MPSYGHHVCYLRSVGKVERRCQHPPGAETRAEKPLFGIVHVQYAVAAQGAASMHCLLTFAVYHWWHAVRFTAVCLRVAPFPYHSSNPSVQGFFGEQEQHLYCYQSVGSTDPDKAPNQLPCSHLADLKPAGTEEEAGIKRMRDPQPDDVPCEEEEAMHCYHSAVGQTPFVRRAAAPNKIDLKWVCGWM